MKSKAKNKEENSEKTKIFKKKILIRKKTDVEENKKTSELSPIVSNSKKSSTINDESISHVERRMQKKEDKIKKKRT